MSPHRFVRPLRIALPLIALGLLALHVGLGYRDAGPSPLPRQAEATADARDLSTDEQAGRIAALAQAERAIAPRPGQPDPDSRLLIIAAELAELAQSGNPTAAYRLGWYYLHGWGVERDRCSATEWFFLAARAGNPNAQFWLAMAYLPPNGQGVTPDKQVAFRWASAARTQELAIAVELFFFFTRDLSPEERRAAEASLADWTPATATAPIIQRYPYIPVLVGFWPRQSNHVIPCRQDDVPLERWDQF